MKRIKCLIAISCLLFFNFLYAQKTFSGIEVISPLSVGDKIPDFSFAIKNYHKPTARISDFKGKLIILDFWFSTCIGCINMFPEMEAMQAKWGDKFQVLGVNFETQGKIDSTFFKHKISGAKLGQPKFPSIIGDTAFHQLFSIRYYPHYVWVDETGNVIAITEKKQVTKENVLAMIEKKPVKLDMKFDDIEFNSVKYAILPQLYDRKPEGLKYYSVVLDFVPGTRGSAGAPIKDNLSGTARFWRINNTILQLFGAAMIEGDPITSPRFDYGKRVELRVKDSARYVYDPRKDLTQGEWDMKNCYSYEAVMPIDRADKMKGYMLSDLERFFNIECKIEKRRMKCLALVRTSNVDKIRTKEGRPLWASDPRNDSTKWQLFALKTEWLVGHISRFHINTPYVFFDNTGYTDRIDIVLPRKVMSDIPALRKELAKYDLDLIESEQELEVFVVIEKEMISKTPK